MPSSNDYDLEAGRNKEGGSVDTEFDRDQLLTRIRTSNSVSIPPELFEKLYLSPEKHVKGNLRQTFANPTPAALLGHVICICPLGCDLLQLRGAGQWGAASTGAFVFLGGLLLILSGIFEFILGNTFSFVVFFAFGGFWLSFAGTLVPAFNSVGAYSSTGDSLVLGLNTKGFQTSFAFYLLFWTMLAIIMTLCALRTNVVFVLLFFFLDMTLLLLTIGYFTLSVDYQKAINICKAGGATALACGLCGMYLFVVLMFIAVDFPILFPVGDLSHKIKGWQEKHGPLKNA
ncbi:GPR1/FUN34/yaaH family-domain-containing protein [Dipodascopsis tothii]|uniref:GPR1/FUN34/yaaH family-domain-containing protein n=1 Tax=Dipodascopsis tothii TaxID=44089 RepID=UPI0034CD6F8F